jgi:hypothetical protein
MDKFDPNLVLVNVNKLKPYQILDDEAQTIDCPKPIYWEGQKDVDLMIKKKTMMKNQFTWYKLNRLMKNP